MVLLLSVLPIIFMHTSFTSVYKFKIVHASYARSLQVAVEDGQAAGNCMVLSTHIHRNGLCIAIHRLPSLSFTGFGKNLFFAV